MKIDDYGFSLTNSLRRKLAAFVLLTATCLSAMTVNAEGSASFAGIQIGMDQTSLPSALRPDAGMTYKGVLGGDYIEVSVSEGKVDMFQVRYFGKNSNLDLISKPITLRQAVARHSVNVPNMPVFAKSISPSGMPTGLADTANFIMYYTGGSVSPETQVQNVYYANPGAPFANVKKSQLLSEKEVAELQRPLTDTQSKSSGAVSVTSAKEYLKANTREAALDTIQRLVDETLGTGRRLDALIGHAEIWLGVDQRHPEAKQTFCDLSSYNVKFNNSYKSLFTAYAANRFLLSATDIEIIVEPAEMRKLIDRRMRQVSAMGYDSTLCLLL